LVSKLEIYRKYPFLLPLVSLAIEKITPTRILLFGSRAREEEKRTSDFDVAFDFPKEKENAWGTFCVEAEEELPTLHRLDLLNLREASEKLLAAIKKDGVLLYENETTDKRKYGEGHI